MLASIGPCSHASVFSQITHAARAVFVRLRLGFPGSDWCTPVIFPLDRVQNLVKPHINTLFRCSHDSSTSLPTLRPCSHSTPDAQEGTHPKRHRLDKKIAQNISSFALASCRCGGLYRAANGRLGSTQRVCIGVKHI